MTKDILQPGEILDNNRYKVVRRAYPGNSYSQIYLVEDKRLDNRVHFLKINLPHDEIENDVSTAVYNGSKDDHIERTKKEIKLLNDLRHPHIISANNTFRVKNHYQALVFESLPTIFNPDEYYSYDWSLSITRDPEIFKRFYSQMVDVVDFLKEWNYLHRDIKPENILFGTPRRDSYDIFPNHPVGALELNEIKKKGNFKLIDFGLATKTGNNDGQWGSILYQPPEVYRGEQHPNSDLWSLGLTLYEYLSINLIEHGEISDHHYYQEFSQNHMFGFKGSTSPHQKNNEENRQIKKELRKNVKEIVSEAAHSKSAADNLEKLIEGKIDELLIKYKTHSNPMSRLCIYSLRYLLKIDPKKRSIRRAKMAFEYEHKMYGSDESDYLWKARKEVRDIINPPEPEEEPKSLTERLKFWKK